MEFCAVETWGSDDIGAKSMTRRTICMTTRQGDNKEYRHYDVHSLYGLSQMITTQK